MLGNVTTFNSSKNVPICEFEQVMGHYKVVVSLVQLKPLALRYGREKSNPDYHGWMGPRKG